MKSYIKQTATNVLSALLITTAIVGFVLTVINVLNTGI